MTNRYLFFLPIMTISGSVTILQTTGKFNGLLNKLTKQHPLLRWQNLLKILCRRQTGLEEQSAQGLDKYFLLSISNAFFIKKKMLNCVLQRFSYFRTSWWLSSHLQRTVILPSASNRIHYSCGRHSSDTILLNYAWHAPEKKCGGEFAAEKLGDFGKEITTLRVVEHP